MKNSNLIYPELSHFISSLDLTAIPEKRKAALQELIAYIQELMDDHQPIELIFICTHNSRRSHLAQVWAQTLAAFYQLPNIECYSGGTEATAVYPMIVEVLENSGFKISSSAEMQNPVYSIYYSSELPAINGFSKLYNDPKNPHKDFAAIMTCSQADENCPFIPGAKKRISITYEDPKVSDGTKNQKQVYMERNLQIAQEMKYIFSSISTF